MTMQAAVRIIPRLEIKGPHLLKGFQFDGYRILGKPEEFAAVYEAEGADELIIQDVVASLYQRGPSVDIIERIARKVFIPITVAGGLSSIADIRAVLRAGADKVAINTAGVESPEFIANAVKTYGSQCIVASIEAHRHFSGSYEVWTNFGRQPTGIELVKWVDQLVAMGVGEIVLTAVERDGTGLGYDLELTKLVAERVGIPVIASGGAGSSQHMIQAIHNGGAHAVSAASVFHYNYLRKDPNFSMTKHYSLRMGAPVDNGNVDFLYDGYGDLRQFPVTPISIPKVKNDLAGAGIAMRMAEERSV